MKQVDVAIGVLAERAGPAQPWRVLIARRLESAPLGGYWELPGGKAEAGEALEACVAREFAEEVGLSVQVGEALTVIEHRYPHAHVRLHPYFCERLEGEPRNLHVAEHRWVSPEELRRYRFPEANGPLIEEVIARLRSR